MRTLDEAVECLENKFIEQKDYSSAVNLVEELQSQKEKCKYLERLFWRLYPIEDLERVK